MASISINNPSPFLAIPWLIGVFFVFNCIVIVALAIAVMADADGRVRSASGLFLVGPWFWFFVVIGGGGYLPALAYWLIHYSSLRYRRETPPSQSLRQ